METVELVIKIPKRTYDNVSAIGTIVYGDEAYYIGHAIANGIPLPKGHGKLIDADSMKRIDAIQRGDFNSIESIRAWIDIMPTVVEADKTESEG